MSRSKRIHTQVEACIAPVSFPKTTEALLEMIEPDSNGKSETHLQNLLDAHDRRSYRGGWSAPRWFSDNDIFFFYHSKRALRRIGQFMCIVYEAGGGDVETMESPWSEMLDCLGREWKLAQELSGTVFACARVAGPAEIDRSVHEAERPKHWRSRIYASIKDVWAFDNPLALDRLTKHVKLSTGGGLTPVHGRALSELRDELAKQNEVPQYLANAIPGRSGFREVSSTNWRERTCNADSPRFIDEAQLRCYFADYLLAELKDSRTPLFEECRCDDGGSVGSIADYFMCVHGVWLPVEAKLSIAVERALLDQIRKYLMVTSFTPLRGSRARSAQQSSGSSYCLIIDSAGVYLMSESGLVGCSEKKPLVSRDAIGRGGVTTIREKLRQHLR